MGAPRRAIRLRPPFWGGGAASAWSSARCRAAFLSASLIRLMVGRSVREVGHVAGGAPRIPVVHLVGLPDERREHGLVAEVVDDAGYPPAGLVYLAEGPWGERRAPRAAGKRQPVLDVMGHVPARQGMQLVVDEDALAELAQLVAREELLQLRLAHEHDLEQLLLVRLKV